MKRRSLFGVLLAALLLAVALDCHAAKVPFTAQLDSFSDTAAKAYIRLTFSNKFQCIPVAGGAGLARAVDNLYPVTGSTTVTKQIVPNSDYTCAGVGNSTSYIVEIFQVSEIANKPDTRLFGGETIIGPAGFDIATAQWIPPNPPPTSTLDYAIRNGNNTFSGTQDFNGATVLGIAGGATPDATSSVKGKLKLAGDLGGTADLPTVPGLAAKQDAFTSQAANRVYASPNGSSGLPAFRALVSADIPALPYLSNATVLAQSITNVAHKWLNSYNAATGQYTQTQPDYGDLTGLPQLANTKVCTGTDKISSFDKPTGNFTCTADQTGAAGGGITTLNGLTTDPQTFAKVDDTNMTLAISSLGSTHTFTLAWASSLSAARGGTGTASNTGAAGKVLMGNGAGAFVEGDPLVQGLFADGSTSIGNPVAIGGYDTAGTPALHRAIFLNGTPAGTEYGMVVRNIPSGTQPISAASLPLPSGAATDRTTAAAPAAVRLSDGSAFYKGTTPSDTQPISAASLPLPTGAAQDATLTGGTQKAIVRGGAKGSTTAADVTSTASGANHQPADVAIYDASGNQLGLSATPMRTDPTGTTTQPISAASLPLPAGAAQEHTAAATPSATRLSDGAAFYKATTPSDTQPISAASLPLPAGAAQEHTAAATPSATRLSDGAAFYKATTPSDTQPISAASLPLPSGAAQDATLTGGTAKAIVRGGAKGSTTAADVTSTASGANHQPADVAIYDASGNQLGTSSNPVRTDPTGTTAQPIAGTLADNGAAAGTNRAPTLPGIYETSYNGGTAGTAGRNAAHSIGTDGLLQVAALPAIRPASYTASAAFAGSSTTDIARLPGNASNTVLVTMIKFSCTQTTAGAVTVAVNKRSTAGSGGTAAAITVVPDDSNYAAGVSAPQSYTGTGPTVGTLVGAIDNMKVGCLATSTASPQDIYILNLRQKPIVLRGTAENVTVNLGGAVTGGNVTVTFNWIETATITP